MDMIVRNARLASQPEAPPVDIGVVGGRIAVVAPHLDQDVPTYDAAGCLVCAGFVETHIHLDKSRIIDRCTPEPGRSPEAMQRVAAVKHTFSIEDVYARAGKTLEECIKHGTTRMRTHVELDGGVEMRSFEAIEALRHDYAWAIDLELCVFPQESLTDNPRSDELLVQALKRGAKVIGAAPNYDPDKVTQIHPQSSPHFFSCDSNRMGSDTKQSLPRQRITAPTGPIMRRVARPSPEQIALSRRV